MLSNSESVSLVEDFFGNQYVMYGVSLFTICLIIHGSFRYIASLFNKPRSTDLVIDEFKDQNIGKLNVEVSCGMKGELKPDLLSNCIKGLDHVSKRTKQSVQLSQATKQMRRKIKKKATKLVQNTDAANLVSSEEIKSIVSDCEKQYTDQLQVTTNSVSCISVGNNDDVPLSQKTRDEIEELEGTNQLDMSERNKDIEGLRRMLQTNPDINIIDRKFADSTDSGTVADISDNAEYNCQEEDQRRKKRLSRSVSRPTTGTATPRLPKLTPIRRKGFKYIVEVNRDGGILKLTDATLKFPAYCIEKKVTLSIALIRKQEIRRGDENAIFATHALHMWMDTTSQPDDFSFRLPIRVNMVKSNSDDGRIAKVQRTNSMDTIVWEFYEEGYCGGDYISFDIRGLGGYRAISPKHSAMIDLHYQICVTRCHETTDPDQHSLNIKFYTEDLEKSVLAEARSLPGLEVLNSELITVQAGSTLQLSLWHSDHRCGIAEFNVPKYEYKIKKTISIQLTKLPAATMTTGPMNVLLKISSQFSETVHSPFELIWKKRMNPQDMVFYVNGKYAVGIQHSYRNILE